MKHVWSVISIVLILTGCRGGVTLPSLSTQVTAESTPSPTQVSAFNATATLSSSARLAPTQSINSINPDKLLVHSKIAMDQLQSLQLQISRVSIDPQKPEYFRGRGNLVNTSSGIIETSIITGGDTYGIISEVNQTSEFLATSLGDLYTKYPGDALWVKEPAISSTLDYISQFNLPQFTRSATIVGEESYNNVDCIVVSFGIDPTPYFRKNFDQYAGLWDGSSVSGSGKVWIGKNDLLIYKESVELHREWPYRFEEIYLDFLLRSFNKPLNIPQPEPAISKQNTSVESGIRDVAISLDGKTISASDGDQNLFFWSPDNLTEPRYQLKNPHQTGVDNTLANFNNLAFSPNGKTLAASSLGLIDLFDLGDLAAEPHTLQIKAGQDGKLVEITLVAYSPDGKLLAAGDAVGKLYVWDTTQLDAAPQVLGGHKAEISELVFSPDGGRLISSDLDGKIIVREINRLSRPLKVIADTPGQVSALVITPDGKQLLAAFPDSAVLSWSLDHLEQQPVELMPKFHQAAQERRQRQRSSGGGGPSDTQITALAFSPDGKYLAVCRDSGMVRLYLSENVDTTYTILRDAGFLSCSVLAFSADGKFFVSGGDGGDGGLSIWTFTSPVTTAHKESNRKEIAGSNRILPG